MPGTIRAGGSEQLYSGAEQIEVATACPSRSSACSLSPVLVRWHRKLALLVGLLSTLSAGVVIALVAARVLRNQAGVVELFSNERPIGGRVLGIAFVADPFGVRSPALPRCSTPVPVG